MSDFSQPEFQERCSAVCGLYVDPPANVLVVSIDEKTGIQAKAPTKPDVPPGPTRPARREHESTRNGTGCLFAALKVHQGEVVAMASKTRNRFDLIRFPGHRDSEIPVLADQKIVAISDNRSARGAPGSPGLAAGPSALELPVHPDSRLVAQPGRNLLLDTRPPPAQRTTSSPARRTSPNRSSPTSRPTNRPPSPSNGRTRQRPSKHESTY